MKDEYKCVYVYIYKNEKHSKSRDTAIKKNRYKRSRDK